MSPTAERNLLAKALFEAFEVASVLFAPSHLLATFPYGTKTALVIDIGYKETLILPVSDKLMFLFPYIGLFTCLCRCRLQI